jgi:hypothetical protein
MLLGYNEYKHCSLCRSACIISRILNFFNITLHRYSKIIAPTISLNSGKIVFDYYLNLDGNNNTQSSRMTAANMNGKVYSSIRAHVDPTTGIIIKWTDGIKGGGRGGAGNEGSCWVTECRVPLGTSGPGPLAADVRVGRRWVI